MRGKWTLDRQEACLYRTSSPLAGMLSRGSTYRVHRRDKTASVDEIIAKILVGNIPDRKKAEEALRSILA